MKFRAGREQASYTVSPAERDELTHWLDMAIATAEPEDVTGQFLITNSIDEAKWHQHPGGQVNGWLRRRPLQGSTRPEDLTDLIIEKGEILEGNAAKGILFDTSNPKPGEGIVDYTISIRMDGFVNPRYSGRLAVSATPPNVEKDAYDVRLEIGLHNEIWSRTGSDHVRYVIPRAGTDIVATIAHDPADVVGGCVRPRPFDEVTAESNGLGTHVAFISNVLGIEPPDFLR